MNSKIVLKSVALLLSCAALALFSGCGGTIAGGQNPPPSIAVSLSAPPSSAVIPGGTASITATVSNDGTNSGVFWSCTAVSDCGSFIPSVTASGTPTTFKAPSAAPNNGKVTITATSVRDNTKSASFVVTIGTGISVIFSPAPPITIQPGQQIAVGAIVANDPANAGVNWSCAPTSTCGSFSLASTASGTPTSYTAPATAPPGGTVTIIATSITDISKGPRGTAVISAAASNATLSGQYSLSLTSPTGNRGTSSLAGSVTVDGNGNVLGGVVDIVSPALIDLQDQILPTSSNLPPNTSSYLVGATGRGTLRIRTANGQTLDFSFALTSAAHALLAEIDGNPGSGSLDIQHHPSGGFDAWQIAGRYSFTMTGTAKTNPATKVSFGGIVSVDGISGITSGTLDVNTEGVMATSSVSGTFTAPDSNGRGIWNLGGGRSFVYYIISPKALRILEADTIDLVGGSAYSSATGNLFPANDCFYEHSGWSSAGLTVTAGHFFLTESDVDIVSGISDSNAGGAPSHPITGIPVTGRTALSFSPNGTLTLGMNDAAGVSAFIMYPVDPTVDMFDPGTTPAANAEYASYALLLHTDASINGTGLIVEMEPQQMMTTLLGNHAFALTNPVSTSSATNELDLVGVGLIDASGNFTNGVADYDINASFNPSAILGASFTGASATALENSSRFSGSITLPTPATPGAYPFIGPSAATFAVSIYQISSTRAFVIQADSSAIVSGFLIRQLFP